MGIFFTDIKETLKASNFLGELVQTLLSQAQFCYGKKCFATNIEPAEPICAEVAPEELAKEVSPPLIMGRSRILKSPRAGDVVPHHHV